MPRLIVVIVSALIVSTQAYSADSWRSANSTELRQIIPARAQVQTERIETEFRTASGITDGNGKFIAGVVLITAGYAAEGKYSNFVIIQARLRIEELTLQPGTYVFGWKRSGDDALEVSFYEAGSGKPLGVVTAKRTGRVGRIESFHISPPGEKGVIEVGRFAMHFEILQH
jgi:hypothetical protein